MTIGEGTRATAAAPQARRRGSNALDLAALSALLLVGIFFLTGLSFSGGYRIYFSFVSATWALLFASAIGRCRSRHGRVWLLALLSPLVLLGPLLALAFLDGRVRKHFVRDLSETWNLLPPFPLGTPTTGRLILAAAISAGVFVIVMVFMAIWLGLAGGSPSTTFVLWFVFAPAGVLSALTLIYLVIAWIAARGANCRVAQPDAERTVTSP